MSGDELQEVFARTLRGDYNDDQPWEAVRELRYIGTRDVLDIAAGWCHSADPLMRARGADVIAQLGKTGDHPSNNFPQEAFAVIAELVRRETEIRPLSAGIFALGQLDNSGAVPLVARYQAHPDPRVRYAVTRTLGSYPSDADSVAALLKLTADDDPDVRDWATFGLGVLGDADTPEIREALAARLLDTNQDAREEAVVALAKRHDRQTLPALMELLEGPDASSRVIEAASLMLGMVQDEPELKPHQYREMLKERFTWPCPRCGRPFTESKRDLTYSSQCQKCGLDLWSEPGRRL